MVRETFDPFTVHFKYSCRNGSISIAAAWLSTWRRRASGLQLAVLTVPKVAVERVRR